MSFKEFVIKNCEAKELRSFDNIVDSLVSLVLIYFTAFFIQKILVIHKEAIACFICICLLALFSIYSIKWVKFITSIYRNLCAFILIFIYPLAVFVYIYYTPKFSSIDNKYLIIFFYSKWLEVVFFFYLIWLIILLKDLKKFIWGVQIQSLRSTAFAIIFMLFSSVILSISVNSYFNNNLSFSEKQTIYYQDQSQQIKIKKLSENQKIEQEILKNKIGEKIDDHLSGLGDIMIGIGSALMALSIFVYESIARKRHYFDKYYLTGLTNNIVLTILYFIGLFGLLLVYVFENYDWVKNFLEPTLYCYVFLLIIFAVIRFYHTAIGMLFREKGIKIEKQIVESFFENLQRKKATNFNEYSFLLEDFFADTINKLKEGKIEQVKDDWIVINFYLEKWVDCIQKNPKIEFDPLFFFRFLFQYLHYIPKEIDPISFQELIYKPKGFFALIIDKNILIKKNDYQFSRSFQEILFYYQAMYQKGSEMQKEPDKLSSNEQYIANKLLIESRRAPKKFAHSYLLTNYKNNKINPEFFENYAKEFLIYFRNLALKCFKNNDVDNFKITIEHLLKLFWMDSHDRIKRANEFDKIGNKLPDYKAIYLYELSSFILYKTNEINFENNFIFLNSCNEVSNKIFRNQSSFVMLEGRDDYFIGIFNKINFKESWLKLWTAEIKEFVEFKESKDEEILNRFFVYNFLIILNKCNLNKKYSFNNFNIQKLEKIRTIISNLKKQIELYPNFLTANYPDEKIDIIIKLLAKHGIVNISELVERCEKIIDDIIKKNSKILN